jgi:hypothetical protein
MIIWRPKHEIKARTKLIRADFARLDADALREELFNRQSGKCFWCTKDLSGYSSVESQIDHLDTVRYFAAHPRLSEAEAVRLANAKTNLVLDCSLCNQKRNCADPEEFYEQIQRGEIALGESRKWTLEEIEQEKQRISERNQKGGRAQGRRNIESGQLASIAGLGGRKCVENGLDYAAMGRIGGRKGGRNQPREVKAANGRSTREKGLGIFAPGASGAGSRVTNCLRWNIRRGKPCVCGRHGVTNAKA